MIWLSNNLTTDNMLDIRSVIEVWPDLWGSLMMFKWICRPFNWLLTATLAYKNLDFPSHSRWGMKKKEHLNEWKNNQPLPLNELQIGLLSSGKILPFQLHCIISAATAEYGMDYDGTIITWNTFQHRSGSQNWPFMAIRRWKRNDVNLWHFTSACLYSLQLNFWGPFFRTFFILL